MFTLTKQFFVATNLYKWNMLLIGHLVFLLRVSAKDKTMARISFMTIIAIALAYVLAEEELYSNRYDDVDFDGILTNEKLRKQYYNCFMDIAPCKTGDAKFFKGIVTHGMPYVYCIVFFCRFFRSIYN